MSGRCCCNLDWFAYSVATMYSPPVVVEPAVGWLFMARGLRRGHVGLHGQTFFVEPSPS